MWVNAVQFDSLFTENVGDLKRTGSKGQMVGLCPFHDDTRPSLSVNLPGGLWQCFAGCGGGDAADFAGMLGIDPAPYYRNGNGAHSPTPPPIADKPLPGEIAEQGRAWYAHLRDDWNRLAEDMPWTREGTKKGIVGYDDDTGRFTYTHLSADRVPVNVKHGKGSGGLAPFNIEGHGQNRLYPYHLVADYSDDWLILAEGEPDVVTLLSHGFQTLSATAGVGSVPHDLSPLSKFRSVIMVYDSDEAGRKGSIKMAEAIMESCPAVDVYMAEWPGDRPAGYDVTDFFREGGTAGEFEALMLSDLKPYQPSRTGTSNGSAEPRFTLSSRQPVMTRLSDVEPEEVEWLWNPYIPLGKLTLLEGDPAVGKTWLALQIAAIISKGHPFPAMDGIPRESRDPGRVIYMSAEDGLADTLRPRLDKIGADPADVIALTGWREIDEQGGETSGMVSLGDIPVIEAAMIEHRPSLLVVDPLQAYFGAGVDMHRANEVRPVLAGLSALAERNQCAVLVVRHLNKSSQSRSIYRGLGSIDFAAAARSIILAGQDPQNPQTRVIAHLKSSLAEAGPSLGYELNDGGFRWTGISELTPEALLAPTNAGDRSAVDEAAEWLQELLREGALEQRELKKLADTCGLAWASVRRAKDRIGARSTRSGFGHGAKWLWTIDAQETP